MKIKNIFIIVFMVTVNLSSSTIANSPKKSEFTEGLQYQRIESTAATHNKGERIEVLEFFLYACPHCNNLEPKLKAWLKNKPDNVDFRRIPAIVGPSWADQAKVYYTAEKLGIVDRIHEALFKSIHEEGKQYYNESSVMEFFLSQGVKPQNFLEAYNSLEVTEKTSQARIMTVKYGLRGVPAMVVNGKYKTAQYFTGSQELMLSVVDMLIEKERIEIKNRD